MKIREIAFILTIWIILYLIGYFTHAFPATDAQDRQLPARLPDNLERRLK